MLGAVPGMIVVTALTMVDFVGPRDTLPPQVSARFEMRVASKGLRKDGRENATAREGTVTAAIAKCMTVVDITSSRLRNNKSYNDVNRKAYDISQ